MASSLLAFNLKKSTATTISATLLTNLLRLKTPLTTTLSSFPTATIRRSLSSIPPDHPGINYSEFKPDAICVLNPFQTEGPRAAVTIKTSKDNKKHKTVRVEMPGVGENGYKVWLDTKENAVCVEGKGEIELLMARDETSGRTYTRKIKFEAEEVKVEKIIKSEMKHGILRITLSRNLLV